MCIYIALILFLFLLEKSPFFCDLPSHVCDNCCQQRPQPQSSMTSARRFAFVVRVAVVDIIDVSLSSNSMHGCFSKHVASFHASMTPQVLLCSTALSAVSPAGIRRRLSPLAATDDEFVSLLQTGATVDLQAHAQAEAHIQAMANAKYEYAEHHDIATAAWSQYIDRKYPEPVITSFTLDLSPLLPRQVSKDAKEFLSFTYADLVGLAGDFIGIWNKPVGDKNLPIAAKEKNFMTVFNSFLSNLTTVKEQQSLWKVRFLGDLEQEAVNERIERSDNPSLAYKERVDYITTMFSRASENKAIFPWTAWKALPDAVRRAVFVKDVLLVPNRFMDLALHNYDHFTYAGDAQNAYIAAHRSAIRAAVDYFTSKDPKLLIQAFAMNAFADHFLTDIFASGHMTTPRQLLAETCPMNTGNLVSECMHAEVSVLGFVYFAPSLNGI